MRILIGRQPAAAALAMALAASALAACGGSGGASAQPVNQAANTGNADLRSKYRLDKPFAFKQGAGTDLLPEYIAKEKGFFSAYNLDVKIVPAKVGGVAWIPLLASGEIDATAGAGVSATMVTRANGAKVIAVAAGFVTTEQYHNFGVWVRAGSGIKAATDLIGKRVAIANVGSTIDIGLDAWVRNAGGDPSKVKKVVVPYANMPTALVSNQVDAIGEVLPTMTPWLKTNASKASQVERIAFENNLLPSDKLYTTYAMRSDFVDKNPKVVSAWTAAMTEATEWMTKNPQAAADIAVKADAIPSADGVILPAWPKGLCIDATESKAWLDLLVVSGQLKQGAVGPDEWYTNRDNPSGCK
jgi:NitT/TauT family transport system substrate-binding protein